MNAHHATTVKSILLQTVITVMTTQEVQVRVMILALMTQMKTTTIWMRWMAFIMTRMITMMRMMRVLAFLLKMTMKSQMISKTTIVEEGEEEWHLTEVMRWVCICKDQEEEILKLTEGVEDEEDQHSIQLINNNNQVRKVIKVINSIDLVITQQLRLLSKKMTKKIFILELFQLMQCNHFLMKSLLFSNHLSMIDMDHLLVQGREVKDVGEHVKLVNKVLRRDHKGKGGEDKEMTKMMMMTMNMIVTQTMRMMITLLTRRRNLKMKRLMKESLNASKIRKN